VSIFAKPKETLTVSQAQMLIRSMGESYNVPAKSENIVPHRLIVSPMAAKLYKPEPWHVPTR